MYRFSSFSTDMVLQDLKSRMLEKIKITLSFYIRYVDDIALAVPPNAINKILNMFNFFHSRL